METMCAILAAVAHDLDHPGVNQHFLIATNSHLASLYNNLSVLESHHWRFAVSCLKESHVFDHFNPVDWNTIRHLLRSLILATDITQQASYLAQFRIVMSSLRHRRKSSNKTDQELFQMEDIELEQELDHISIHEETGATSSKPFMSKPPSTKVFNMKLPESRLFILTIALKCADLGNPCRPWDLSKRWSEQICAEFYRQGDFERQLDLPVTPICNRYEASMAKIQTGQFTFLLFLLCFVPFIHFPIRYSCHVSFYFLQFLSLSQPSTTFSFLHFQVMLFHFPHSLSSLLYCNIIIITFYLIIFSFHPFILPRLSPFFTTLLRFLTLEKVFLLCPDSWKRKPFS